MTPTSQKQRKRDLIYRTNSNVLPDGSYRPHQGEREMARRRRHQAKRDACPFGEPRINRDNCSAGTCLPCRTERAAWLAARASLGTESRAPFSRLAVTAE